MVVEALHRGALTNVLGVVMLDVVEGTAVESLASMRSILSSRPTHFPSIEHAIKWAYVMLFAVFIICVIQAV